MPGKRQVDLRIPVARLERRVLVVRDDADDRRMPRRRSRVCSPIGSRLPKSRRASASLTIAVRVAAESVSLKPRPARSGTSSVAKNAVPMLARSARIACEPAASAETGCSGPNPRYGTVVDASAAATPGICFKTSRIRAIGTPPLFSTRAHQQRVRGIAEVVA